MYLTQYKNAQKNKPLSKTFYKLFNIVEYSNIVNKAILSNSVLGQL